MNWKYSLAIHGTVEQIKEFTKELDKIGYEENAFPYNLHEGDTLLTKRKVACQLTEGYDYFSSKEFLENNADYHFNLPEEKEVALALATMRNDESTTNLEEWYVGNGTNNLYVYKGGFKYLVKEVNEKGDNKHDVGQLAVAQPLIGRKATAQEIIEYFKRKPMEKREIIGYKAPYDMFDEEVKAGSLFIQSNDQFYISRESSKRYLPKEIVEKWEPVYKEEEKTVKKVINGYTFDISKKGIYFIEEGKWINTDSLEMLLGNTNTLTKSFLEDDWTSGYCTSAESYKIGCTSGFKREDIERVLAIYNKLNKE